jgi:hypothetical protein
MKAALSTLWLIGLAGCATADPAYTASDPAAERRVAYRCEDGPDVELNVVFASEIATIESPSGPAVTLRQRPAGSGLLYESPGRSLLRRGDELTYVVEGDRIHCREGLIPR